MIGIYICMYVVKLNRVSKNKGSYEYIQTYVHIMNKYVLS